VKRAASPSDFDVKNADYANKLLISENTEDKYRGHAKMRVETKATYEYLDKIKGS
jgi:hypothetical protein